MSHTPGPWKASPYSSIVGVAVYSNAYLIAGVRGARERSEADAHLIAAAPDMVSALRAVLAEFSPLERPYSMESYLPDHIVEQIKTAVAKAEGRA